MANNKGFDPSLEDEEDGWETVSGPEEDESPTVVNDSTLGNFFGGLYEQATNPEAPGIGYSVPIVGAGAQLAGDAFSALLSKKPYADAFREARQNTEKSNQDFEKKYPAASFGQSMIGGMAMPFGRAAQAIKGSGMLSGAGRAAANIAEGGAVATADQAIRGDENPLRAGLDAAKMGAYIQGGILGLKGLGRGYSQFMAGIKPQTLDRYIERRPQVNNVSENQILDEANEALASIKGGIQSQKGIVERSSRQQQQMSKDKWASNIEDARQQRASTRAEADRGFNASKASEDAYSQRVAQEAKDQAQARASSNAMEADELERAAAEEMSGMMQGSRKKISQASSDAFRALDDYEGEIPLKWHKGMLTKGINQNKIGNALLPNEGVDVLQKYRGLLDQVGSPTISATDAKKLIQAIDADLSQAYANAGTGGYNTPAIRSLMTMRRLASARLKRDVPGYAEAMEPVAKMTGTMKGLQREFPNQEADKILPKLRGIGTPAKRGLKEKIGKAEQQFDGRILDKIRQARDLRSKADIKGQSFDPANAHVYDYLKANRSQAMQGADDAFAQAKKSADFERMNEAAKIEQWQRDQMSPLNQEGQKFGGMGSSSMQNRIRRIGGDPEKNIISRRQMQDLGSLSGRGPNYFTEAADDLAVKRAMEGTFIRGSRNVNMAGNSMAGLAKALSLPAEGQGTAGFIGSLVGGISDMVGPRTVKAVIDMSQNRFVQPFLGTLRRAALAGPQAFAYEHNQLLKKEPAYREAFEQAMGEDEEDGWEDVPTEEVEEWEDY